SPGLASLLAAPLAIALKKDYRQIRLKIAEVFAPELHYQLVDGSVDLALLSGSQPRLNIRLSPLLDEKICAIGLAGDARLHVPSLDVKSLSEVPLILTGVARSGVLLELESAAKAAGVELHEVIEVASHDVARRLVEAGLGWTVHFAAPVRDRIQSGVLAAVPIQN